MVRWALFTSFLIILPSVAACGRSNPVSATPTSPRAASIAITGRTSLNGLGDAGQLTAIATFSDNTSKDVTADAGWSGSNVVAVERPGVIKAIAFGTGSVSARYQGVAANAAVRVAPAGAALVSGWVTAIGGFPISDATVEFSSLCGTYRATTDAIGGYILPAEGAATMRVEKAGFRAQMKQLSMDHDGRVDFELEHLATADDLTGAYRMAFTASPTCSLPAQAMRRSYDASLLQIGQDLFVLLRGGNMVAWGGLTGFTGSRDGNAVRFVVRDTFDDGYNLIERIDAIGDLYYSGTASGTADGMRILATFSGTLSLRGANGANLGACLGNHQFELTRTGTMTSF